MSDFLHHHELVATLITVPIRHLNTFSIQNVLISRHNFVVLKQNSAFAIIIITVAVMMMMTFTWEKESHFLISFIHIFVNLFSLRKVQRKAEPDTSSEETRNLHWGPASINSFHLWVCLTSFPYEIMLLENPLKIFSQAYLVNFALKIGNGSNLLPVQFFPAIQSCHSFGYKIKLK